jgi:type III secretory pathway component EscS
MGSDTFGQYLIGFMLNTVLIAGTPLAVATVLGLVVSFFQAVTQINDQTLSLTVKIAAIVLVLLIFGSTLVAPLVLNSERVFSEFWRLG